MKDFWECSTGLQKAYGTIQTGTHQWTEKLDNDRIRCFPCEKTILISDVPDNWKSVVRLLKRGRTLKTWGGDLVYVPGGEGYYDTEINLFSLEYLGL
jgi:hypothetical protein